MRAPPGALASSTEWKPFARQSSGLRASMPRREGSALVRRVLSYTGRFVPPRAAPVGEPSWSWQGAS
jgi:hypothetical protein